MPRVRCGSTILPPGRRARRQWQARTCARARTSPQLPTGRPFRPEGGTAARIHVQADHLDTSRLEQGPAHGSGRHPAGGFTAPPGAVSVGQSREVYHQARTSADWWRPACAGPWKSPPVTERSRGALVLPAGNPGFQVMEVAFAQAIFASALARRLMQQLTTVRTRSKTGPLSACGSSRISDPPLTPPYLRRIAGTSRPGRF